MAFISEIHFRGSGVANSGEFVEITLGPDDDPDDFVVSVYDDDGTLHTNAGIVGGEVNLGTLTGVEHPDDPDFTIYVISVGVRNAASDSDEGSGIALTNVDSGTVLSFYSADNIPAFTVSEGAAYIASLPGTATSESILEHTNVANGESYQWDIFGNLTYATIDDGDSVLCIEGGTHVSTDKGDVCAQDLVVGDKVWTADHGFQPIRWIGQTTLSPDVMAEHRDQQPIRFKAGCMGGGYPATDLIVSRQHRMLIASPVAQRMVDAGEVLVPAAKLAGCDGVDVVTPTEDITYVHILCDQHELISANGALVETLLLTSYVKGIAGGGGAMKSVCTPITTARPVVDGKKAKQLLARITKNKRPLYEPEKIARHA
ncbi:type I secretion protein [Loktanella sp. D2R18]|uniref:Hint domain-containing protein n=1 Tax=Rhodobacterales TaxID=204455 RepID=UPI000DE80F34|nr:MULTISPECIES: Hint domain-containing protein [Rhodobacterales]MDO6589192.1 Hint domain-containing protein [Yoonia sp. 1_MG-2023]RBW45382.1 type I secretion protein [Loktanella sp. D2R18]